MITGAKSILSLVAGITLGIFAALQAARELVAAYQSSFVINMAHGITNLNELSDS